MHTSVCFSEVKNYCSQCKMEHQLQLTALRVFILFMLAAASGISAGNPCTVLLCSLPLPLNEIKQNISTLLQVCYNLVVLPSTQVTLVQSLQSKSQTSPQETIRSSTPHIHQSKCSVKRVKCFQLVSRLGEVANLLNRWI